MTEQPKTFYAGAFREVDGITSWTTMETKARILDHYWDEIRDALAMMVKHAEAIERIERGDDLTILKIIPETAQFEGRRMTGEDLMALNNFIDLYPTWWWRIGVCDVSRDFTCAPQAHSPEAIHIRINNIYDNGFSCDHKGSIADAINQVMQDIDDENANTTKNTTIHETVPLQDDI